MIIIFLLTLLMVNAAWAIPLDKIVAVVNDEVILESELDEKELAVRQQLRQRDAVIPSADILTKQVLERLIIEKVQLQKAARVGVRVGDDALNAALRQIADNNKLSLREFRNVLESDGFKYADFRDSIRQEMIISRLRKSEVEDRIIVSDREIDNYLTTQAVQGNSTTSYH